MCECLDYEDGSRHQCAACVGLESEMKWENRALWAIVRREPEALGIVLARLADDSYRAVEAALAKLREEEK